MRVIFLLAVVACGGGPDPMLISGERVGGFYEDADGKVPMVCNDGSPATGRFSFTEGMTGGLEAHYDLCGGRSTSDDFRGHHRGAHWDGSMDSGFVSIDDGTVLADGTLFAVAAITGRGYRYVILRPKP